MTDLQGFKSAIDQAKSVIVCLPENPNQDIVASSLALYLSLSSYGKQVIPLASSSPVVRDSHLVGLDKITSDVGGNNLVITFNLPEDAVDKVTSNTEGGHLNLIIAPKKEGEAIKPENLSFSFSGGSADLIIVVGAGSLSELGPIAEKEINLFQSAKIINFGNKAGSFGVINLNDPSSSNSELATAVIQELHFPMDRDIAGNLMVGIENATKNLTSTNMTADTFEALAVLYRAGARRTIHVESRSAQVINNTPIIDVDPKKDTKPIHQVASSTDSSKNVSPDWLKPKVLKTDSHK